MADKDEAADTTHPQWTEAPHADSALEDFGGGEIKVFHGFVNGWLLAVYAILAVWGVYYLVKYWGGLGPGLAR